MLSLFLSSDSRNAAVMHSMGLLPKLLFELCDSAVTVQKVKIICCVITSLLKAHLTPLDTSRYSLGMHTSHNEVLLSYSFHEKYQTR